MKKVSIKVFILVETVLQPTMGAHGALVNDAKANNSETGYTTKPQKQIHALHPASVETTITTKAPAV